MSTLPVSFLRAGPLNVSAPCRLLHLLLTAAVVALGVVSVRKS